MRIEIEQGISEKEQIGIIKDKEREYVIRIKETKEKLISIILENNKENMEYINRINIKDNIDLNIKSRREREEIIIYGVDMHGISEEKELEIIIDVRRK